jgi:hypothetical protein
MIDFLNTITMDEAITLKDQFMPAHTYGKPSQSSY